MIAVIVVKMIDPPSTRLAEDEIEYTCGAEYCPEELYFYNETQLSLNLTTGTSKLLISIYLGLGILAFGISCAFLDSRLKEPKNINDKLTTDAHIKSVKQSFQDPKLQLATPLALFVGLEQGFIIGDYTEVLKLQSNYLINKIQPLLQLLMLLFLLYFYYFRRM